MRTGRYGESAVKKSPIKNTQMVVRKDGSSRNLVPALVAVSGGLAALPTGAIELGDARVSSSLGQPLQNALQGEDS